MEKSGWRITKVFLNSTMLAVGIVFSLHVLQSDAAVLVSGEGPSSSSVEKKIDTAAAKKIEAPEAGTKPAANTAVAASTQVPEKESLKASLVNKVKEVVKKSIGKESKIVEKNAVSSESEAEDKEAKTLKTISKEISGQVSALNNYGLALEYDINEKAGSSNEMWFNFNKKLKLNGVDSVKNLEPGDSIKVAYGETKDKSKRILTSISLIQKKPVEVPQEQSNEALEMTMLKSEAEL